MKDEMELVGQPTTSPAPSTKEEGYNEAPKKKKEKKKKKKNAKLLGGGGGIW